MATTTAAISGTKSSKRWIAIPCALPALLLYPWFIKSPFVLWSIAGAALLALAAVWREEVRTDLLDLAAWLPAATLLSWLPLAATFLLRQHVIDASLDWGVGRSMMQWAAHHSVCNSALWLAYDMLPFAMAACMAVSSNPKRVGRVLLLAAVAGFFLYMAFPAVGPGQVGHPKEPRNCMPSLHLAWALMLVYFSDRFRVWFVVFAALMAVATLTTGQHYLVDLIAAVPFTIFIVWLDAKMFRGSGVGGDQARSRSSAAISDATLRASSSRSGG